MCRSTSAFLHGVVRVFFTAAAGKDADMADRQFTSPGCYQCKPLLLECQVSPRLALLPTVFSFAGGGGASFGQ